MDWHSRFLQQATWTRDLRAYLFEQAGLPHAHQVLEVGCGTGAILSDLILPGTIHGVDKDLARLVEAHQHFPGASLVCGNALSLPYPQGIFDITFCHFLLLWVSDPLSVLLEMKRVTRPAGAVLALAEPDYASRVDKPDELAPLGVWQAEALQQQGADPGLGKRLSGLFQQAGIPIMETGTLRSFPDSGTGHQGSPFLAAGVDRDLEWAVLEADLEDRVPPGDLLRMKRIDEQAWQRGERVLHVPTYFAWGLV
jgi:SAM-dependent methyltransferase